MANTFPITSRAAWPFYIVLLYVPFFFAALFQGGIFLLFLFLYLFVAITLADKVFGENSSNFDPSTEASALFWFRLPTLIWAPLQALIIFVSIYKISHSNELSGFGTVMYIFMLGAVSGLSGIVIAHELIHQHTRLERRLGDILLAMVNYSHFRTEHLFIHHRYVATPKDSATARYNESIYRFLLRVVPGSFRSAWHFEGERAKTRHGSKWHRSNPFYLYAGLTFAFILIAFLLGGLYGVFLWFAQAVVAVTLLEVTNYIEHYGLVRRHLGEGKYEPVAPRHSWNTNYRITNYFLINLQRHSDHHYKPARRYPLLQSYDETEAPQLPYGYLYMGFIAMNPRWWRRVMNARVRRWRSMYYPDIIDWTEYNKGTTPLPR